MLKSKRLRKFLCALVAMAAAVLAWVWVGIESSLIPAYADICSKNEYTGDKECATYHIALVALWHIVKALNDYSVLITALATAVIGYFTYTLWRATSGLLATAENQADDMKTSLYIAEKSVEAAKQSAVTTYAAFIAAHRPRIILRAVYFNYPLDGSQVPDVPVKCIFVNIGDSNADDVEFFVKWEKTVGRDTPPAPVLYEDEPPHDDSGTTLNSGDQIIHNCASGLSTADIEALARKNAYFTIGKIIYRDKLRTRRTTGFCRWYDPQIRTFRKLDGSKYMEYEYED